MPTRPESVPDVPTPQETAAILRRILAAVEGDHPMRWMEIISAVVLSLATLGSAWCAYQSNLWSGVQTFRLAAATTAGRQGAEATVVAMQARAFDGTMLISFLEADSRGDARLQDILRRRFRPEMKAAVDAWLKTDPLNNPDAPLSPFKMAEYKQPQLEEAKHQDELFAQEFAGAQDANQASDKYVLLTVLFASVLFFAGIGGTFQSARLRLGALGISLALFMVTLWSLAEMPICRQ